MMKLNVCILQSKRIGNCSNNGQSSRHDWLELVWDHTPEELEAYLATLTDEQKDAVCVLVKRVLWGEKHWYATPAIRPDGVVGPMAGGCFIETSDSRFPWSYPIPLHDRFETQKQYDMLSR